MRLFPPINPYIVACAISAILSLVMASRAAFGTKKELSRPITAFESGVFAWCLFAIVRWFLLLSVDRFLAFRLQYLGIAVIPGSIFAFVRALDKRPLKGFKFVLAHVPGGLLVIFALTNELHSWMWSEVSTLGEVPSPGPAYWLILALIYVEILIGLGLILRLYKRSVGIYKRWMRRFVLIYALPTAANILYHLFTEELGPYDPTPIAFAISGYFLARALDHFNLLDAIPYAKEVILETLDSPFVVTDSEGYVVGENENASSLFQGDGELEGQRFVDLFPELEDLVVDSEYRDWSREGVDYLVTCHEVKRGRKSWRGRMYLFRDMSPQMRIAREREEALAKADAANAAKSALIAVVSHDLRNPLGAIIGLADLDLHSDVPPALREDLEVIRSSGNVLLGLVNDLLDLSKIEAGKMDLERTDFDLHGQVASILRTFRPAAEKKGVVLDAMVAEGAPRFVKGDPLRFSQVLMNLVSNAVKFTESGAIVIQLEGFGEEAPEGDPRSLGIRCSVIDTGIGIAPDKLPRLFREFSQADASVSRRFGGTGLGLSICKKLVELFGGRIGVDSREGEGSAFTFTARFEPGDCSALQEADGSCLEGIVAPPRKLSVLIVEDEPVNEAVARRYVERFGHVASWAASGAAALALVAECDFDLVLLDLGLPDMEGFEAARRIRADARRAPPIAAMTARVDAGLRAACASAGMISCLSKPIQPEAMAKLFERVTAEARELGPRAAASVAPPALAGSEEAARPASGSAGRAEEALIDEPALVERLDGDEGFMRELLAIFVDEAPGRRSIIEEAAASADASTMHKAAHGLKGCALSLCAAPLAKAAGELEAAASAAVRRDSAAGPGPGAGREAGEDLPAAAARLVELLERSSDAAAAILGRGSAVDGGAGPA